MTGKNKNKILGILVAVLAVVCILYFVISNAVANSEAKKESEAAAESEANRIWVTNMEDVTRVDLIGDDETLTFVKEDDVWYYDDDRDFPVNQSTLSSLASVAGAVEAVRAIETADDLTDYGLDTPVAAVQVADAEGNSVQMYVGDATNSEYYLKTTDSDTVYTVGSDLLTLVQGKVLYDFVQTDSLPVTSAEKIQTMEVTADDTVYTIDRNVVEVDEDEMEAADVADGESADESEDTDSDSDDTESADETESETEEDVPTWLYYINNEAQTDDLDANDNLGLNMAQTLVGMSIESCVDYNGTEEELEAYGLDAPTMKITYTFEDDEAALQTVTILVGNATEDGASYYVLYNDLPAVDTISATTIEGILGYLE